MKRGNSNIFSNFGFATTVGFFDGVHAGHRFLIEELKAHAKSRGLQSMIVTFRTHPRKVLHADFQPQLLTDPDEKLELLEATGVNKVVELEFTDSMAKLSAEEFIRDILSFELNCRFLLVGHDHRFGHNREEGFTEYLQHGKKHQIEVVQAMRFSTENATHISSSEIRHALAKGKVERAAELLGYHYAFTGQVVDGYKVGRKIGFPTANLKPVFPDKLIPCPGVYAVLVEWNKTIFKGMMNIGNRPTLDNGNHLSLEVHLLDFEMDIYNQKIKVSFISLIREEIKFESLEALTQQLTIDRKFILEYL